jgi:hypothetical protein
MAAGSSGGRFATSSSSASTPPAEAPTTMMSCPSSVGSLRALSLARPSRGCGCGSMSQSYPCRYGPKRATFGRGEIAVHDDSTAFRTMSRTLVEELQAARADRLLVIEAARRERRRGRRLRERSIEARDRSLHITWLLWSGGPARRTPDLIPAAWAVRGDVDEELARAGSATADCAAACLEACLQAEPARRRVLVAIAGVAGTAEERIAKGHGAREAVGLCARFIDASTVFLDGASTPPEICAASAARRCSESCKRALAAMYACPEQA